MADTRGRKLRGRKKVRFEEILPSTDLPPLVQGDLRCFLVVDVGRIFWSSTATAQVPPASPAYVRLRWWGETSEGTLFKPSLAKNNEKPVKCRCRFGVRSGAKQMSAYFVDMGSIIMEVLTSPKSVPLGRIQIPKVAHLSSSNPVRDFFSIYSPSSRKIGELEIHIRFKSLEAAYDLTTDTGTDTSLSSRSRPASEIGRRSRSRGSSVGSNRGSARSRSSSVGSGRKRRSGSRSKGRRRSRSTESNASSASKRSQSVKKGSIDSATPVGVDEILQQNGHDLYALGKKNLKFPDGKAQELDQAPDELREIPPLQQDAISVLLQRGNQLREDILRSQLEVNSPNKGTEIMEKAAPAFKKSVSHVLEQPACVDTARTPNIKMYVPLPLPKIVTPIKERKQDLDMRFVDLVFGSQEFKNSAALICAANDCSRSVSPLSSMISELEDNPLYDESLLQQMFYNDGMTVSLYNAQKVNDHLKTPVRSGGNTTGKPFDEEVLAMEDSRPQHTQPDKLVERLAGRIPGISVGRLTELQRVRGISITIETLALRPQNENSSSKPRHRKSRGRGGKPPMPSPKGKQRPGTYFVEFRFPDSTEVQREHPSSMTTTHDVTRVASRRGEASASGGRIVFDESCEFQFRFTEANIQKWSKEELEFLVHCKKPSDKRAQLIGTAAVALHDILTSNEVEFGLHLNLMENENPTGSLKVSIDLLSPSRDNTIHTTTRSTTPQCDPPQPESTKLVTENQEQSEEYSSNGQRKASAVVDTQGHTSSIALSPSTSVLYMMVMVQQGMAIPGTTVISPRNGATPRPPNISLVCRTLTSGESGKSPIVWGQSNPRFDFIQVSPVKLDSTLLSRMQNNFIIIEVWTKITSTQPHSDKLLGLAKLPLHHFYQSLKDEEISRVVLNSLHPLISVDEPVPIVDLFTGQERGQLQTTLALGTQTQISSLRKIKSEIQGKHVKQHHLEVEKSPKFDHKTSGPVKHIFEVNVVRLNSFKPRNQVWGETDCFIQYQFPAQKTSQSNQDDEVEQSDDSSNLSMAAIQSFRTDVTLCVPDPTFNDTRQHTFSPPPSVLVQQIILSCCYADGMPGGVPFELWSRYYHPNVRDQLLAKGTLPIAKLSALVTMTKQKASEQSFHIPMEFVDSDESEDISAGKLEVHVKYKSSGTTLESVQPPVKFAKPLILKVALLRACGLKAAAKISCRHGNSDELRYSADIGVNTYVEVKPSFLPDEEMRTSRIVARSFAPEYQHHMEIACPLVSYHRDIKPVSLAELMLSGEMEFAVWHRAEDGGAHEGDTDTLLATLSLPMRILLHKTTGINVWHPLKAPEQKRSRGEDSTTVGGIEISMSFASSNDLDLLLKAGRATGWSLPPFESRLLNDDVIDNGSGTDCVTFSVTVTNAWLPRAHVFLHGRTSIDKNAMVYLRYKFFDHDSVTSSLCSLTSKQPHSIDARFENLTSARIAHKKSFACRRSRPLNWYLREEKLELQIWLTHANASKKSRPMDTDKLMGSCYLDLSTIADLDREQHISGSFNLFKAGLEDLEGGLVRVYASVKPGDIVDTIPDPDPQRLQSEEEVSSDVTEQNKVNVNAMVGQRNEAVFSAMVTVERAMHLPLVGDLETDKLTEPNCFVSYDVVCETTPASEADGLKMITMTTKNTNSTQSPVWSDGKEVALPRHLLTGAQGALLLKVWHRDRLYVNASEIRGENEAEPSDRSAELMATDRMLGFATVDLSVLSAGLRDVNGWYNILDIHGQCQGQLKVAVTPTQPLETSQPATARSSATVEETRSTARPLAGPQNFMHQAPIDIPVQTPSGSLYFPGLPSSAQTVATTCEMEETEKRESLLRKSAENFSRRFSEDFSRNLNRGHAPSHSMFRYASSDRQQACLVNTLEKQIQELESIKTKFEQRRAAGFASVDSDARCKTPLIQDEKTIENRLPMTSADGKSGEKPRTGCSNKTGSTAKNRACCHDVSPRTVPADYDTMKNLGGAKNPMGETALKLLPTDTFQALPNSGIISPNTTNGISSPRVTDGNSPPSFSPTNKHKSVHLSLHEPHRKPEFDGRPLSDNEATSDLEFVQPKSLNESTRSDFRDELPAQSDDRALKKPPHTEPKHRIQPDPLATTPARSEAHSALDDTSLWLTGSTLRVSGFSSDEDGDKKLEDQRKRIVRSPIVADPRFLSSEERISTPEEAPPKEKDRSSESSNSGTDEEREDDEEEKDSRYAVNSEGDTQESKSLETGTDEFRTTDEPHQRLDAKDNKESCQRDTESTCEIIVPEPPSPAKPCSDDTSPKNKSQDPRPAVQSPVIVNHGKDISPSFFPPARNLEASMRALQEATLKHKHDLTRKKKEHPVALSSPESKPRKVPPRPADYSDERTRRLAKIFRTTFS